MSLHLHRAALAAASLFVLLLAACAELLRVEAPVAPPAEFPEGYYQQALKQGKPVYRADPAESLVVIEVRRGGSLARLGHDHVVASHDVTGYVAPGEGRADLYAALARLVVDEPALRKEAGFDTQPTESDIEGTRSNMLNHVLEAEKFPFAVIGVKDVDAKQGKATLAVAVTLHGVTRTLQVPAEVQADAQTILVSGRFAFNQSDFGITPYSLLGGAIAVKDGLELRFRIRARRAAP
ncbi:MAG TPA: YceI family protein [Burkholderiales bacterium]|nr:YceI family protein [Burkholderiales bacterium]